MKKKKVRILSLDGGGIRGVIPAVLLDYLENRLRAQIKILLQTELAEPDAAALDDFLQERVRISQFFDLVAGTSTGGILTCLYLCPTPDTGTLRSAADIVAAYESFGDEVFKNPFWQKLKSGFGYTDPKYSSEPLQQKLALFFGTRTLSELVKPCLVTSYDIRDRKAVLFTSNDAKKPEYGTTRNFYVKDVALSTAAAPTYFKPTQIRSLLGAPYDLIDGGLYANNPALCAYAEARKIDFSDIDKKKNPSAENMLIISLGTGSVKRPYLYEDMEDAGAIGWVEPVIDILMSSNSETIHYILHQMYETLDKEDCEDYHRLEPALENASSEMDCATTENIRHLKADAFEFISKNVAMMNTIAKKLLDNGNEVEMLLDQFRQERRAARSTSAVIE